MEQTHNQSTKMPRELDIVITDGGGAQAGNAALMRI
jgi:hypothetical protein